jgi:signal transduction histidine kinase
VGARDAEDATVEQELRNRALDRRVSIGSELDEGILASLYSVVDALESSRVLIYTDPHACEERLKECVATLGEAVRDLRACVIGPSSRVVRTVEFTEALNAALSGPGKEFGAQFDLKIDEDAVDVLSADQMAELLEIGREACLNALRHGRSRTVAIRLRRDGRGAAFTVQDNGRGYAPSLVSEGRGLADMRARAARAGGRLEVVTRLGNGTRIIASLPPRPGPPPA